MIHTVKANPAIQSVTTLVTTIAAKGKALGEDAIIKSSQERVAEDVRKHFLSSVNSSAHQMF